MVMVTESQLKNGNGFTILLCTVKFTSNISIHVPYNSD